MLCHVGLSNPPGSITVRELPWPNNNGLIPIEVSWSAPLYTGNLPSIGYLLNYNYYGIMRNESAETTSTVVNLLDMDVYSATLEVFDGAFNGSDVVPLRITVEAQCAFVGKLCCVCCLLF